MAIEMNRDVFERCMHEHGRAVYRVAWAYSLSKETSDDVFQETFLSLWKSNATFENEDHLRHWLLRVASNKSKDALRRKARQIERNTPLDREAELYPGAPPTEDEHDSALWDIVAKLPDDMRAAVIMHYCEGYSTEEIAEACGCAHTTVRTRLFRARARLERMLKEVRDAPIPR